MVAISIDYQRGFYNQAVTLGEVVLLTCSGSFSTSLHRYHSLFPYLWSFEWKLLPKSAFSKGRNFPAPSWTPWQRFAMYAMMKRRLIGKGGLKESFHHFWFRYSWLVSYSTKFQSSKRILLILIPRVFVSKWTFPEPLRNLMRYNSFQSRLMTSWVITVHNSPWPYWLYHCWSIWYSPSWQCDIWQAVSVVSKTLYP